MVRGRDGKEEYLKDPTVPRRSITPTYAIAVFVIKNERWAGKWLGWGVVP